MQRYFIESEDRLIFSSEQIRHMTRVMRMKPRDRFEAVYRGKCYVMEIRSLEPFCADIVEELSVSTELEKDLTLLYCLPKGEKLDLVIQKATEIGVRRIILVESSRCVCRYKAGDFERKYPRLKKIAVEASEQSRRLSVPEISGIIPFSDIGKLKFDRAYIAYENERTKRIDIDSTETVNSIGILIGSEGGFSKEEALFAEASGYRPVSLGKRILRSETACFYALSVLAYLLENADEV